MTLPYEALSVSEARPGRPFTAPAETRADMDALREIAAWLRAHLAAPGGRWAGPGPQITHQADAAGRPVRLVIGQDPAGWPPNPLAVVGFFGQRRPQADPAPIDRMDARLLGEFRQHPAVLAYASRELPTGQWGNLVLLAQAGAGQSWRAGAAHREAVEALSPPYYAAVRIHNAELPAGLSAAGDLVLLRTKYYAYAPEGETWRGLREYTPPARFPFG